MASQPTAYLCSYPKSGRTWMRFALVHLMDSLYGLGGEFDMKNMFDLIPNRDGEEMTPAWKTPDNYRFTDRPEVPFLVMSHLPWEPDFAELPAVFLVRSPGDVIVSWFHHMTRHDGRLAGKSMIEFAADPDWGVPDLVSYLASWEPHLDDPNVTVVTYEQLRAAPVEAFGRLAAGLGIEATPAQLEAALEAASVDRMRKVEAQSGSWQPHDYDLADPDARRVRKAKVGGWLEEMDEETVALMISEVEASPQARALLERAELMPARS